MSSTKRCPLCRGSGRVSDDGQDTITLHWPPLWWQRYRWRKQMAERRSGSE